MRQCLAVVVTVADAFLSHYQVGKMAVDVKRQEIEAVKALVEDLRKK
jgi:hypothetical protein